MKHRCTFTLDREIAHRAKGVARDRGQSLSSLVEELLAREVGSKEGSPERLRFSERWSGKVALADKGDARFQRLKEKHGL